MPESDARRDTAKAGDSVTFALGKVNIWNDPLQQNPL
jgi:hypothetical protein